MVSIDSKYNCALEDAKARPFTAVSHDLFVFKTGNFRKRVERTLKPRIVLKNIKKRKWACETNTERESGSVGSDWLMFKQTIFLRVIGERMFCLFFLQA